jgi:hypothetical protein
MLPSFQRPSKQRERESAFHGGRKEGEQMPCTCIRDRKRTVNTATLAVYFGRKEMKKRNLSTT